MSRVVWLIVTAMLGVLLVPLDGSAQTAGIKLGKPFEGEAKTRKDAYLSANGDKIVLPTGGGFLRPRILIDGKIAELSTIYVAEVPVVLKAGQSINISTTVKGTGRKVAIVLVDPDKKPLDNSGSPLRPRTVRLKVEEVNATGKYTIMVISDKVGAYTLLATGPRAREPDETELKEKIKELEEELANLKRKLKALQDRKRE
jgi:hypothetical protein